MPIQPEKITPSLFVAIPSSRDWKSEFSTSMIHLSAHLMSKYHEGKLDGITIKCQISSLLPQGRQSLLNEALESGCSHMLWIDDDTKFPVEAVDLLLSRDLDYVAANLCRKQYPLSPTAQKEDGSVINSAGKTGVEEAQWLGLGMCLLRLDAVRNIPAPHFEVMWLKEKNKYLGEDMYFCGTLHSAGIKLYVDHDVSNLVGHVGDHVYQYPEIEMKKKEAA